MTTDHRTSKVGAASEKNSDEVTLNTIEKLEKDLKGQAESLRQTRQDYVNGMLTDDEFAQVEAQFAEMLVQQRQVLQNLRKSIVK